MDRTTRHDESGASTSRTTAPSSSRSAPTRRTIRTRRSAIAEEEQPPQNDEPETLPSEAPMHRHADAPKRSTTAALQHARALKRLKPSIISPTVSAKRSPQRAPPPPIHRRRPPAVQKRPSPPRTEVDEARSSHDDLNTDDSNISGTADAPATTQSRKRVKVKAPEPEVLSLDDLMEPHERLRKRIIDIYRYSANERRDETIAYFQANDEDVTEDDVHEALDHFDALATAFDRPKRQYYKVLCARAKALRTDQQRQQQEPVISDEGMEHCTSHVQLRKEIIDFHIGVAAAELPDTMAHFREAGISDTYVRATIDYFQRTGHVVDRGANEAVKPLTPPALLEKLVRKKQQSQEILEYYQQCADLAATCEHFQGNVSPTLVRRIVTRYSVKADASNDDDATAQPSNDEAEADINYEEETAQDNFDEEGGQVVIPNWAKYLQMETAELAEVEAKRAAVVHKFLSLTGDMDERRKATSRYFYKLPGFPDHFVRFALYRFLRTGAIRNIDRIKAAGFEAKHAKFDRVLDHEKAFVERFDQLQVELQVAVDERDSGTRARRRLIADDQRPADDAQPDTVPPERDPDSSQTVYRPVAAPLSPPPPDDAMRRQLASMRATRDKLVKQVANARSRLDGVEREKEQISADKQQMTEELARWRTWYTNLPVVNVPPAP